MDSSVFTIIGIAVIIWFVLQITFDRLGRIALRFGSAKYIGKQ